MNRTLKRVLALCVAICGCLTPIRFGLAAGPETASSVCHIGSEYYDTIAEAVIAASSGDTIRVTKDSVLSAVVPITKQITISGDSAGRTISRTTAIQMFTLDGANAKLTLEDITIDGGAVWSDSTPTAAIAQTRTNSGLVVGRQEMIFANNGATIELKSGAVLQNAHALITTDVAFGSAITMWSGSILNMYDGAIVQNNAGNCPAGGNFAAGVCLNERSVFNMNGGIFRGCSALDANSNSGAAVFARSNALTTASTFNMYGTAQITENYNNSASAVTIRASYFNMNDSSSIDHNKGVLGGGILIYTYALMKMNDNSIIDSNIGTYGAGLYLSSNSSDASAYSKLEMYDNSQITNNTASQAGGGAYVSAGAIEMLDNSTVSGNAAIAGGGLYLPKFTGAGREIANLISGKIINNTASSLGPAVYFGGTALNLNAGSFEIDNTIYLTGDGTNPNAKVISLVGAPTTHHYVIGTKLAGDTFAGRDVVRPGTVNVSGTNYSLSDTSAYASFFSHVSMWVTKGAEYFGALSDTSHDTFLVLNDQAPIPTPTPTALPTPTPIVDDPVPKTGDSNNLLALYVLLGVSLAIFGISATKVIKRDNP